MSTAVLPIMIFAAGMSAQGPNSVVLTTEVHTWRAQAVANDVSGFLADRMHETWGLTPAQEPGQFSVRLRWPAPEQVRITISQGSRQWVDRPLPVDDPSSARAMVWLLVRSTVERALIHSGHVAQDETPPIAAAPVVTPVAAPPTPGPDVKVDLVTADEDSAWLADAASPTKTATRAATVEAPLAPTPPAPSSRASTTAHGHGLRRLWLAPFALGPGDAVEAAVVMRGYADPNSGFGWGPAVQARLQLSDHFILGGELGVRAEDKSSNLTVTHIPITLLAGYRFGEGLPLELGVSGTIDPRVVSSRRTTNGQEVDSVGGAVGVLLGTYARAYYSLWTKDSSELRLVGEVGARFGVVRSAYFVDGQTEQDAVVAFSSGLGLEWRWR